MTPTNTVFTYRRANLNDGGHSLAVQADALTVAAARLGLTIVGDFYDEASGMSAPDSRRGLAEVLDGLATGEAKGVLVTSMDRFSRSLYDSVTFVQTVKELGGKIFTSEGEIDLDSYIVTSPPFVTARLMEVAQP